MIVCGSKHAWLVAYDWDRTYGVTHVEKQPRPNMHTSYCTSTGIHVRMEARMSRYYMYEKKKANDWDITEGMDKWSYHSKVESLSVLQDTRSEVSSCSHMLRATWITLRLCGFVTDCDWWVRIGAVPGHGGVLTTKIIGNHLSITTHGIDSECQDFPECNCMAFRHPATSLKL